MVDEKFEINSREETYSVQDGRIEALSQRERLLDRAWYKKTRRLAIADVVYVKGFGLCSHQPDLKDKEFTGHRMKDMQGRIFPMYDDSLFFVATMGERDSYWSTLNKAELRQREKLAELAHKQWSGWMRYLFSKGIFNENGTWTMPVWAVERWKRQMETPYAELSEEERNSDRKEADKFMAVLLEGCELTGEETREVVCPHGLSNIQESFQFNGGIFICECCNRGYVTLNYPLPRICDTCKGDPPPDWIDANDWCLTRT